MVLTIAASTSGASLDGSNALALSQLQSNAGILPAFQGMVSNLGETVATAQSQQTTQDQIAQQAQTQRESVSGVSIDEEMTNLILGDPGVREALAELKKDPRRWDVLMLSREERRQNAMENLRR